MSLVFAAAAPLSLHARRSSNFSLVGSHKITLASLGHSKFPLDKVQLSLVITGSGWLWHFLFPTVSEFLPRHRHLQALAHTHGATLCTSFSASSVLFCQRCQHQGGFWSCDLSSSLPSCLCHFFHSDETWWQNQETAGRWISGKGFTLFTTPSLFHLTAHPSCAFTLAVASVGITSAVILLIWSGTFFFNLETLKIIKYN